MVSCKLDLIHLKPIVPSAHDHIADHLLPIAPKSLLMGDPLPLKLVLELLISLMRNYIHWEILNELSKISLNVCHSDCKGLLDLQKPASVVEQAFRELVLGLGHLIEGIFLHL